MKFFGRSRRQRDREAAWWQDEFPDLDQFFGGYFHQDFACDDPTDEAVIDRFVREAPERVQAVRDSLDELLGRDLSEADMHTAVFALGSYYDPAFRGLSMTEWVRTVRTRLG